MTLLIGATFFLFEFTQAGSDENELQQVAQLGYRVVDEAASMYVYGSGSYVHVTGSHPQGIQAVYVVDENTLVFEIATQRGVVPVQVFSPVPINGSVVDGQRVHTNENPLSGTARYRIESKGSWVEIRQV